MNALDHESPPQFECDYCAQRFYNQDDCNEHMDDYGHHRWECDTCTRNFTSVRAREQHMDAVGHWKHYCTPCQRRFNSDNSLRMVILLFELSNPIRTLKESSIIADQYPSSISILTPTRALMSYGHSASGLLLPPVESPTTSRPVRAQTAQTLIARRCLTTCVNVTEMASSQTVYWNGTKRDGVLTTRGKGTDMNATSVTVNLWERAGWIAT